MSFITIKKSHLEGDLLILKSALESEGIKCYLKNEFTTQIINFMPTFVVELQVSISDFEKANLIINEMNKN
jgi:Putative prokaryotic signal transducing protein